MRRIPLCYMCGAQSAIHETFQQYTAYVHNASLISLYPHSSRMHTRARTYTRELTHANSLRAVTVYDHRLGRRKWLCNRSMY